MTENVTMKAGDSRYGWVRTCRMAGMILFAALMVSACTRGLTLNPGGWLPSSQQAATPLPPAPAQSVESQGLNPLDPSDTGIQTSQGADPGANAQPVTRQAMIGAWTVSTGGTNCQIFLALTKWSGGYRAASRGCSAAAISDVQAWDVKDKQVVLVDSSGSQTATLYRSGETRFDGSTKGGDAISFTR